jgi:hypothetical protein
MPDLLARINAEIKTRSLPIDEIGDLQELKHLYYTQIDSLSSVSSLVWRIMASSNIKMEEVEDAVLNHEAFKWVLKDIIEFLLVQGTWLFKAPADDKPVSAKWRINEQGFVVLEMGCFDGLDFMNSPTLTAWG